MRKLLPIHKLLIRANGMVGTDKIAQYLGVNEDKVRSLMDDMGLPRMKKLDIERAFPVFLRRVHDLLPEEASSQLLGLSVEECRKAALDMDFLDHKLGGRPPHLAPVEVDADGVGEISAQFHNYTKPCFEDFDRWEEPFSFLSAFENIEVPAADTPTKEPDTPLKTRIMYSYTGTHGDFLLTGEDFYSEGVLSRLSNRSVNGGWMPVLLRDLAPSSIFPEFGEGYETRLENLRKQVEKAAKYGVKIYLYFNEPRFMPASFFEKHPSAKGAPAAQQGYFGMCTSDPDVRRWLCEATQYVFEAVPGLGGVVLITASENQTNCFSRISYEAQGIQDGLNTEDPNRKICPKCLPRTAAEVLGDAANLVQEGIDAAGCDAIVMQWLWGWDNMAGRDNMRRSIENLNRKIVVMVDWAKNTEFELFGKKGIIGEYTLAHVKPSPFAVQMIQIAQENGHRVFARNPLVTTVEMNALPYLPVLSNVETLLDELKKHNIGGTLSCWIFGAYPGRNMEMFNYLEHPNPTQPLAQKYYGKGADEALKAWKSFSDGMAFYPTLVSILYNSAINPGPGLKLPLEPEPWRYGMVAMGTENLEGVSQSFGAEVMIKGYKKLQEHFERGLVHLRRALELSDRDEWARENARDYDICEACLHHFCSVVNYSEFVLTRNRWLEDTENEQAKEDVLEILGRELENSTAMLRIARSDSRIGFEGSIGYFYTPMEIVEKIYDLACSIEELSQ